MSVVVAAREEPIELIEGLLVNLASQTFRPLEVIVVWDWPGRGYTRVRRKLKTLGRRLGLDVRVVLKAWRGRGKASAVKAAARIARGDAILVIDVDDRLCSPRILEEAARLLASGYDAVQLGIVGFAPLHPSQRPAAAALTAGFAVAHLGRRVLGAAPLLVGSGLLTRKKLLLELDEDAIVEDVDLAVRLALRGYRVATLERGLCMSGAPGYGAFRVQQSRWARGAGEVVRRRLKLLVSSVAGVELAYTLSSYPLEALTTASAAILAVLDPHSPLLLAYALMLLAEATLGGYLALRALIPAKLRASAAAGAFGLLLHPLLALEWLRGFLKPGSVFRVTPRRPTGGLGLTEVLYTAASTLVLARLINALGLRGVIQYVPFAAPLLAVAYYTLRHRRVERVKS